MCVVVPDLLSFRPLRNASSKASSIFGAVLDDSSEFSLKSSAHRRMRVLAASSIALILFRSTSTIKFVLRSIASLLLLPSSWPINPSSKSCICCLYNNSCCFPCVEKDSVPTFLPPLSIALVNARLCALCLFGDARFMVVGVGSRRVDDIKRTGHSRSPQDTTGHHRTLTLVGHRPPAGQQVATAQHSAKWCVCEGKTVRVKRFYDRCGLISLRTHELTFSTCPTARSQGSSFLRTHLVTTCITSLERPRS